MTRFNTKFRLIAVIVAFAFSNVGFSQDDLERGIASVKRGDYVKAVQQLQSAVKQDPKSYKANLYYGIALQRTGASKDAQKYLETAVGIDNEKPDAYNALGQLYTESKKYDDADKNFNDALKNSGANQMVETLDREEIQLIVDILFNQAANYIASGQIDKAINTLTKAKTFDHRIER